MYLCMNLYVYMMYVYMHTLIFISEMKLIKDLMYVDTGLCLFLTYSSTTLLARRKLLAKTCRTPGKS